MPYDSVPVHRGKSAYHSVPMPSDVPAVSPRVHEQLRHPHAVRADREAQMHLVVGAVQQYLTVSVRTRAGENQGAKPISEVIDQLKREADTRELGV